MDIPKEEGENEASQLAETLEADPLNKGDATMEDGLEQNPVTPMKLRPVIRNVLEFLKFEDIKNSRLVSHEWSFSGKLALANRARINFRKYKDRRPSRLPEDFHSRFQNSSTLFSAFYIYADVEKRESNVCWTIEELALFFEKQQNSIKDLGLALTIKDANIAKNIDFTSWISRSPMVQKDARYMTRLSITSSGIKVNIPVQLLAHIKELRLDYCRIFLEGGIKISPIELVVLNVTFYQEERKLDRVLMNDIVDFSKAKKIHWGCEGHVDLRGNVSLDQLTLSSGEILNGKTSQWVIDHMKTFSLPYSLNRQMNIRKLDLYHAGAVAVDLFHLPNSIEKLTMSNIGESTTVTCSQRIVLKNLRCLNVTATTGYSFLAHFTDCPQLTHLSLNLYGSPVLENEMKFPWMPKSVKTLALGSASINWVDDNYLDLEKLYFNGLSSRMPYRMSYAKQLCNAKIRVNEIVVNCHYMSVNQDFVYFLEYRKRMGFGNRFYVGKFSWEKGEFQESLLKDHVDVQASFYVFENEEKGRALSEKSLYKMEPCRSFRL